MWRRLGKSLEIWLLEVTRSRQQSPCEISNHMWEGWRTDLPSSLLGRTRGAVGLQYGETSSGLNQASTFIPQLQLPDLWETNHKAIWCMVFGVILDTLSHFLTLSPIGFPSFFCLFFSSCKLMSHCFPAYICLMRPQRSFYRDLFKGGMLSLSKFSQDFLFIHVIFRNLIVVCLNETFLIWTVWSFLNFLNWWVYF